MSWERCQFCPNGPESELCPITLARLAMYPALYNAEEAYGAAVNAANDLPRDSEAREKVVSRRAEYDAIQNAMPVCPRIPGFDREYDLGEENDEYRGEDD